MCLNRILLTKIHVVVNKKRGSGMIVFREEKVNKITSQTTRTKKGVSFEYELRKDDKCADAIT